jgi:drug/metabolite transporter superfamily protein YnfA
MTNIVLSIMMLAAAALVAGAFALWRRTGEAKNPALMVLLAVIAVINVLIWTIPTQSGEAPIDQVQEAAGGN